MQLTADRLNHTPILVLPTPDKEPWTRVYGATNAARPGAWVFPGYYPLGYWAASDIAMLTRHWKTPLAKDAAAERAITALKGVHAFSEKAKAQYAAGQSVDLPLPAGWRWHKNEPYNHQRLGIAIALTWWRHFFLWEMGTGKTKTLVESLRLLRHMRAFRRALVLCPAIVVPTWAREVRVHSDDELRVYHWQSSDDGKVEKAAAADVVLVTYQTSRIEAANAAAARQRLRQEARTLKAAERDALVRASVDPLYELEYDTIVGDESHCIGNWDSAQTKAALLRSTKAGRRYLLSGTAADQPLRLYPQMRFLAPGLLPMEYRKFLDAHVVFHPERKYMALYYKGLNGLNARVDTIASRMKKADCVDLPPQVFIDIPFTLGIRQKARYNELVKTMLVTTKPLANLALAAAEQKNDGVEPDGFTSAEIEVLMEMPHGAARLEKLLQVSSGYINKGPDRTICDSCPRMGACIEADVKPYTKLCVVAEKPPPKEIIRDFENPKIMVFEDLVEQILDVDPANKILVWANHTTELDDAQAVLERRGWGFIRIDGKTTHKIQSLEDRFSNDPSCRVSIGIVSAGVGLTLTAANFTIYYALPWNRIYYRQSLDRNNRPGQTRKMTVYRLLGVQTIEPTVAAVLSRKELLAATLTEKIDCTVCPHVTRCTAQKVRPFTKGCIYQPTVERPVAQVGEVT